MCVEQSKSREIAQSGASRGWAHLIGDKANLTSFLQSSGAIGSHLAGVHSSIPDSPSCSLNPSRSIIPLAKTAS